MPKVSRSNKPPLTKKRFERLLNKAAQPISEWIGGLIWHIEEH